MLGEMIIGLGQIWSLDFDLGLFEKDSRLNNLYPSCQMGIPDPHIWIPNIVRYKVKMSGTFCHALLLCMPASICRFM